MTVLLSTHNVEFARTVADELQVLADGEIAYRGTGIDPETVRRYGLRTWHAEDR